MADTATFSELFTGEWPNQSVRFPPHVASIVGPLLLLAACGKSAQVPFSGWLPRAMEGPTPSSAIFYGALSVHIGAYLLLRAAPLIAASALTSAVVVLIGTLTTLHGTLAGRVAADAKTALAFASLTQVGVIFVEIGLGLHWLALLHIVGHSFMRSLQFLRAPSLLHDHHQLHAASGGDLGQTGHVYERLLPERVRAWLYRFAVERSHLEPLLDRLIARPALRLAQRLNGSKYD
jgi:NAD(P)H-quinone oxidoreductase subunit 5